MWPRPGFPAAWGETPAPGFPIFVWPVPRARTPKVRDRRSEVWQDAVRETIQSRCSTEEDARHVLVLRPLYSKSGDGARETRETHENGGACAECRLTPQVNSLERATSSFRVLWRFSRASQSRISVCAGKIGSHACESPAGRMRRFTTERTGAQRR